MSFSRLFLTLTANESLRRLLPGCCCGDNVLMRAFAPPFRQQLSMFAEIAPFSLAKRSEKPYDQGIIIRQPFDVA